MAIKITEECINCGACEPECPNNAIYEGGVEWAIADGTTVKGSFTLLDGSAVDADAKNSPSAWIRIILFPISVQNARVSMKSPSALQFARLTAVSLMICIRRRWMN